MIQGVSGRRKGLISSFVQCSVKLFFSHNGNLSKAAEGEDFSCEGQTVGEMAVDTLFTLHTDKMYDLFWDKVSRTVSSIDVSELPIPRKRCVLQNMKMDCPVETIIKSLVLTRYILKHDKIISCAKNRFDQPGYRIYSK